MLNSGFAAPVWFRTDGTSVKLTPVPLGAKAASLYDEAWLQRLLFQHPDTLPIAEIDDSFSGLIPLCMELDTPAGPVDAVFVTPSGRLALLETKLWRNPEARREVVGQILDYAKELTNWDYSRLDTKVRQARKAAGGTFPGIVEIVAQSHDIVPHRFQDSVTKSLARGDYLLILAGDGIREGVGAIAQYLDRNSSLHFTFGLVECAIFEIPGGGFYVQPRILAQTTKITRTIIAQPDGKLIEVETEDTSNMESGDRPDLVESREKYQKFWTELLGKLHLESSQPIPAPARSTNQYFAMPRGADARLSAYLGQSRQKVGVYIQIKQTPDGSRIYEALLQDREDIEAALVTSVEWHRDPEKNQQWIIAGHTLPGDLLTESRLGAQKWMADNIEKFTAVFRPRIERIMREGKY